MSAAELLALADRCEAATGADRGLDAAIWREAQPNAYAMWEAKQRGLLSREWDEPRRKQILQARAVAAAPAYTASLDAAMELVPKGCQWGVDSHYGMASVYSYWQPRHAEDDGCREFKAESSVSSCLALALTAAALRARAAEGGAS